MTSSYHIHGYHRGLPWCLWVRTVQKSKTLTVLNVCIPAIEETTHLVTISYESSILSCKRVENLVIHMFMYDILFSPKLMINGIVSCKRKWVLALSLRGEPGFDRKVWLNGTSWNGSNETHCVDVEHSYIIQYMDQKTAHSILQYIEAFNRYTSEKSKPYPH